MDNGDSLHREESLGSDAVLDVRVTVRLRFCSVWHSSFHLRSRGDSTQQYNHDTLTSISQVKHTEPTRNAELLEIKSKRPSWTLTSCSRNAILKRDFLRERAVRSKMRCV
jgi:hypothetical protein